MALARICWLSSEAGGRKTPFTGSRYITVVRFPQKSYDQSLGAWSLVVDLTVQTSKSDCVDADVHFLVDEAPTYLLCTGQRFELLEGERVVAIGEVLSG